MAAQGDVIAGQLGGSSSCTLLQSSNAVSFITAVMTKWISDINSTCPSVWNPDTLTFGSTCACGSLPSHVYEYFDEITNETIEIGISGYVFNTSYSKSIFYSDFPASSPYVVSVGATMINPWTSAPGCGSQSQQEIYAELTSGAGISDGGGFSVVSKMPSWQSSSVASYLGNYAQPPSGYFNSSNRGYPDISLNGHKFPVVVNGTVQFYDGTSASSPSLAAMFALINDVLLSHGKPPLGLLNPLLYEIANAVPDAFTKITPVTVNNKTLGTDYSCTRNYCCKYGYKASSSGWDPVTGLGTPNMLLIENYVRSINGIQSIAQEARSSSTPSTSSTSQAPASITSLATTDVVLLCVGSFLIGTFVGLMIQQWNKIRNSRSTDHADSKGVPLMTVRH